MKVMIAAAPGKPDAGDMDNDGCIPVPLAALAQPDDKEQMQTPAEGDAITLQVEATIEHIDGKTAYIKPTAINGQNLDDMDDDEDEQGSEKAPPSLSDQASQLQDQLEQNGGQLP